MLASAPACTNPSCCVNFEPNGNRISTLPRPTKMISAASVFINSCREKLSRTLFSNDSNLLPQYVNTDYRIGSGSGGNDGGGKGGTARAPDAGGCRSASNAG